MDNALTEIVVLLDRSGSMQTIANDVVGGLQTFIDEQCKCKVGRANLSLIMFDSEDPNEVVFSAEPINTITLKPGFFQPRAGTPLFDALGRTINSTGERFSKLDESQRPGKVVFLVMTDGAENMSREFSSSTIKQMIKHQEEVYKWQFIYIGADVDVFTEAGNAGIQLAKSSGYSKSAMGLTRSMIHTASNIAQYRTSNNTDLLNFSSVQVADMTAPGVQSGN